MEDEDKVRELKGLNDLKTAMTVRLRSKPAREGTEYLELYLATNEKKRLANLTRTWKKQATRTQARRAAVIESIATLEKKVGVGIEGTSGLRPSTRPATEDRQLAPYPEYTQRRWGKVSLDY